jgi:sulfonate transport system substrate-binding protein
MIGFNIGGVPEHFNLPWRLAIESGAFKASQIDLHWSDMSGGTGQMIRGLETGTLDVAVLLTEGITKAILHGLPAKIIQGYVISPLHWGIHVPVHSDIQSVGQLQDKVFAISREGSGSQLMAYVVADQQAWDPSMLQFNVVGDVYGGLWALQNDAAQAFLWEKYTTHPYVEQHKCRYIDEVVTPWPCFVVAARTEIAEKYASELQEICSIINKKALEVKQSADSAEMISWKYNLDIEQAKKWLSETEWNYKGISCKQSIGEIVHYFEKIGQLTPEQTHAWEAKLF